MLATTRVNEKGAKSPDVKNLCYVESTYNGWMKEQTTVNRIEKILQTFTFGTRQLLAWDSYRAHLAQSVNDLLRKSKVVQAIVPGGATGHEEVA